VDKADSGLFPPRLAGRVAASVPAKNKNMYLAPDSGQQFTPVRHVTGNDEDYLRKIPRVVVQKSALL
jgi:hypothetical protein